MENATYPPHKWKMEPFPAPLPPNLRFQVPLFSNGSAELPTSATIKAASPSTSRATHGANAKARTYPPFGVCTPYGDVWCAGHREHTSAQEKPHQWYHKAPFSSAVTTESVVYLQRTLCQDASFHLALQTKTPLSVSSEQ